MAHRKPEIIQFEQFLNLLDLPLDYEKGIEPQPDFKILFEDKVIGVEHTRLFLSKDSKGDDIVKHNIITDRIVANAEKMFKQVSKDRLTVNVYFASSYGLGIPSKMITRKDEKELSKFLFEFVSANIPEYNTSLSFNQFDMRIGKYILPDKIRRISIYHKYECWTTIKGGVVPNITGIDLVERVAAKDTKIENYTQLFDEIWLLIVESQWHQQNYYDFDDVQAIEVSSRFNKVFILRAGNNKLYKCYNIEPEPVRWKGTTANY